MYDTIPPILLPDDPANPRVNVGWFSAYEILTGIVKIYGYQQTIRAVV